MVARWVVAARGPVELVEGGLVAAPGTVEMEECWLVAAPSTVEIVEGWLVAVASPNSSSTILMHEVRSDLH